MASIQFFLQIFLPLHRNSDHWYVAVINGAKEKNRYYSLRMDKSNYAADKDLKNTVCYTAMSNIELQCYKHMHLLYYTCV